MRILIFDTHYQESLRVVYENEPQIALQSSSQQLHTIYETGFGRADSLPFNLRKLGHEVEQFIVNAQPIQISWAKEHGLAIETKRSRALKVQQRLKRSLDRLRDAPTLPGMNVPQWELEVLTAQARTFKPEVIFICDVLYLPAHFHR